MNFFIKITLTIVSISITSATFQSSFILNSAFRISHSSKQHHQSSVSLNQTLHGPFLSYTDGYSSIMKGLNGIDVMNSNGYETFATWKNQNPNEPFLDNFENQKGIVKKVFRDSRYFYESWEVELTFYDGNYIDKPTAKIHLNIEDIQQDLDLNRSNGTMKTKSNYTIAVMYLNSGNKANNYKEISGQVLFYFVDKYTKEPLETSPNDDISRDSVQINFVNNNYSSSILTSSFSHYNDASTSDVIIHYSLAATLIIVSLFSCYTQALAEKVSVLTVCAAYASSSYILIWIAFNDEYKSQRLMSVLLIAALVDFFKILIFLALIIKAELSSDRQRFAAVLSGPLIAFILQAASSYVKLVPNLFPSLIMLISILIHMNDLIEYTQPYLTRFQFSNWLYVSMWMGYTYLNPYNTFMLSPSPILAGVFFGIILIQIIISFVQQKRQRRTERRQFLIISDAQVPQPVIIQYPANNQIQNNQRDFYGYSFVSKADDAAKLADECAICIEKLRGENQERLYKTPCEHIFHEKCLRKWGTSKMDCPYCRKPLPKFKEALAN